MKMNSRFMLQFYLIALFSLSGCATMEKAKEYVSETTTNMKTNWQSMQAESNADEAYYQSDLETAFAQYLVAAESGNQYAQFMTGSMQCQGEGTQQDVKSGANWLSKSANQGYPPALYAMGVLKLKGVGVKTDIPVAVEHFKLAAEKEYAPAMYSLGVFYATGIGVKKEPSEATRWFRLAKAHGIQVENSLLTDSNSIWEIGEMFRTAQQIPVTGISQSEQVHKVQARLSNMGYDPGPVDGKMGKRTALAIREFQKEAGLEVNGGISATLVNALNSI